MGLETNARSADQSAAIRERYLLVMTATVIPAANAAVKRADPRLRLEDYKQALRYWLAYPHPAADRILLLENSGADLTELRAIAADENPRGKKVEILSVPGNRIPEGTNYGYTEMEMLDEGLAVSKLRAETTHMIKVTGRLTFPSLGKALDLIPEPFELMVDCRKLGFPRRGYDASTQLFVCSHDFYNRELRDSHKAMNSTDVRLLEHLIFRKVIPFKGRSGYYLRFPCNVEPVGYSGFKSRSYNSPKTAITRAIRGVLRVLAPNYWF
jgi:hypothetical protein